MKHSEPGQLSAKRARAYDREETIAEAAEILRMAEAGLIDRLALRLFLVDGTWKDIVVGGSSEWQAAARREIEVNDDRPLSGFGD